MVGRGVAGESSRAVGVGGVCGCPTPTPCQRSEREKVEGMALVDASEAWVRGELEGNDGSHDWHHVDRVRRVALRLGREEGLDEEALGRVEVAALLHDVRDWKYSGSEVAGAEAVGEFLRGQGCTDTFVGRIQAMVAQVGFKDEVGKEGAAEGLDTEAAVLQDADRLDAIGAIGIARCFTFGGRKNRTLWDGPGGPPPRVGLTKETYMAGSAAHTNTLNHFYEKLLLLKGLMKTRAGRRLAEKRHAFMEAYLDQFRQEWDGQV